MNPKDFSLEKHNTHFYLSANLTHIYVIKMSLYNMQFRVPLLMGGWTGINHDATKSWKNGFGQVDVLINRTSCTILT